MKVEFLREGSEDCPLVRLSEFTPDEIGAFRDACRKLHDGGIDRFDLFAQPWIRGVSDFRLWLGIATWDRGLVEQADGTFGWLLRRETWDNVEGLIEPFQRSYSGGNQWLDQSGETALLLSNDGTW